MNLDETISFIEVTADDYGDDVQGVEYETDAGVEEASNFVRGSHVELQTGELIAWIEPTSDVWLDKGRHLSGMLAVFEGTNYRVTGVRPGGSLLTGEEDLIELTLEKNEDGE